MKCCGSVTKDNFAIIFSERINFDGSPEIKFFGHSHCQDKEVKDEN